MKINKDKVMVTASVSSLLNKTTALKFALVKHKLFGKELDGNLIMDFKIDLNKVLNDWTDISKEIKTTLDSIKIESIIDNGKPVIEYDYIKKVIFGNSDYNSIYDFADGMYQGINDGNMIKTSDINDFFIHTSNMAFGTNVEGIFELIESRSDNTLDLHKINIDQNQIRMFSNIYNYEMFGISDKTIIYKNISDMIDIISSNKLSAELNNAINKIDIEFKRSKIWNAVIDNIINYMLFMILIYVTRIYMIKQYVDGFKANAITTVLESVDVSLVDTTPENESEVFSRLDETIIKDPKKNKEFFDNFAKFIKISESKYENSSSDCDKLFKKMNENELLDILTNWWREIDNGDSHSINELNHRLKCAMTTPNHAIYNHGNAKNELLTLIRKVDYKGKSATIETYKDLVKDLYDDTTLISKRILFMMERLNSIATTEVPTNDTAYVGRSTGPMTPINDRKKLQECLMLLITFYEDFMLAIQQKMIYLERCINRIKNSKKVDIIDMFSLDHRFKAINQLNVTTDLSVPSTIRLPFNAMEMFTLTAFDEACMNDELMRLTPGFENNAYLLEAESTIVNTLITLIQGLINSASIFFFKNFKPASEWVIKNKQILLQTQFNKDDKISNTYKYNINIQAKQFNKLNVFNISEALKNYNKEEFAKDEEKWIKTLYPNDEVYNWFKSNPDTAAIKYRNKLLFDIDSDKPAEVIELAGAELKTEFDNWVNDITKADAIATILINTGKEINQAIKTIKSKSIMEAVMLEAENNPPDADTTETNKKNDNSTEPKVEIAVSPIPKITEAVTNIWKPLYEGIIKVYTDEYRNIKSIYQQVQKNK